MGDKEEAVGDEKSGRGNDWEVVSLTASAYAAAPGPKLLDSKDDEMLVTNHDAETSHPLYMSRHFVFPPTDLTDDKASNNMEQETGKEDADLSDEFSGEDKGKKEENVFDVRAIGGSHVYEQNEPIHEPAEPVAPCDVSPDLNLVKDDNHEVANVNNAPPPCRAWWKRSAASLISQAKETNTVWSIFIAAAVMGIVILGQRWQQERWQILQLKWESTVGNEKAGRLMGPISRLKQACVGGHRRESFIRASSQNDG